MTWKLALALVAFVSFLTQPLPCCAQRMNRNVRPVLGPRRLDKSECLYEAIPDAEGVDRHVVDLKLRFVDGWQEACTNLGIVSVLYYCAEVTGKAASITRQLRDPDGCKLRLKVGDVECLKGAFRCHEGYLPDCVGSPCFPFNTHDFETNMAALANLQKPAGTLEAQ